MILDKKCPVCGGKIIVTDSSIYCSACHKKTDFEYICHEKLSLSQIETLLNGNTVSLNAVGDKGNKIIVYPEMSKWFCRKKHEFRYNWKIKRDVSLVGAICPVCGGDIKSGKYGFYCANKCGMIIGDVKKTYENQTIKYKLSATDIYSLLNKKSLIFESFSVVPNVISYIWHGKEKYRWEIKMR